MITLLRQWPTVEAAEGTVLIDELGAHLHPRWRMRIVAEPAPASSRGCSSSPRRTTRFACAGCGEGEVVVVQARCRTVGSSHVTDLPSVAGLRVDQLLTSEHFGLNSTIDPELDSLFAEYYLLKAKPHRNATETRAACTELAAQLDELAGARGARDASGSCSRRPTTTSRRTGTLSDPNERLELKDATKRKIAAIWEKAQRGQGGPMIRVKLPDAPPELARQGVRRAREGARRTSATRRLQGTSFTFGAYKLDPVKDALNLAFHFKCAYCESFFGATQPLDVEHFRPKSGVSSRRRSSSGVSTTGSPRAGRTSCRRAPTATASGGRRFPTATKQTLGKANQFPISSEAKRAAQGREKSEWRDAS